MLALGVEHFQVVVSTYLRQGQSLVGLGESLTSRMYSSLEKLRARCMDSNEALVMIRDTAVAYKES